MAAIDAAGYDTDLLAQHRSSARTSAPSCGGIARTGTTDLKKFVAEHHQNDATAELGQYVSFALSVGDPPDFKFRYRDADLAPDIRPTAGIRSAAGALLSGGERRGTVEPNRNQRLSGLLPGITRPSPALSSK